MRFAYADPPYYGFGAKYYGYPEWDDKERHYELLSALREDFPDGWALSCNPLDLGWLLPACERKWPDGVRVAAWVKPFAAFKANVRIAYTWEPVIFRPGRDSSKDGAPVGRDHLAQGIAMKRGLTGAKPEAFCRWVLTLLGYIEGDDLIDLFPGSGVMDRVLTQGILA